MFGDMAGTLAELDRMGCKPIVVASHPRSGTHLCIDTLRANFAECASRKRWFERADRLYVDLDIVASIRRGLQPKVIPKVLSRVERPLIKTHALPSLTGFCTWSDIVPLDPSLAAWLRQNATMVYVYRDGRESLCSFHQLVGSFSAEGCVSLSEFLRQQVHGISRVKAWALHVKQWIESPGVRVLTMEHLLGDVDRSVNALARSLGLRSTGRQIERPPKVGCDLWSRIMRRIVPGPPSTAILMPNSGGNQWREMFTPADREFFHQEAGQLLIELGYEESDAWVTDARENGPRRNSAPNIIPRPLMA